MRRAAGALGALALALGTAGCGGADEGEYLGAVNTFCSQVRSSLRGFEQEASAAAAAQDSGAAAQAFGGALGGLSGDLRRATGRLREADPPEEYEDFNAATVRGFEEAARRLDGVAASARSGDLEALRDIDRRLGDLDVPDGPPALRERAPACRS